MGSHECQVASLYSAFNNASIIFLCSPQAEHAVSRENLLEEAKSITIREDKSLPEAQCVSYAYKILIFCMS